MIKLNFSSTVPWLTEKCRLLTLYTARFRFTIFRAKALSSLLSGLIRHVGRCKLGAWYLIFQVFIPSLLLVQNKQPSVIIRAWAPLRALVEVVGHGLPWEVVVNKTLGYIYESKSSKIGKRKWWIAYVVWRPRYYIHQSMIHTYIHT